MTKLQTNPETPAQRIDRVAHELRLTITAEFVPWSQSRNKNEKQPSLNWRVTVRRAGEQPLPNMTRDILTTAYSAGCAHCPSYEQGNYNANRAAAIEWECEHGRKVAAINSQRRFFGTGTPLMPELSDVLYSLVMDADVLDASSFEEWASNLGYDTDSRKAETIYRACLDIALKLRNALGESGLAKLREACQDY